MLIYHFYKKKSLSRDLAGPGRTKPLWLSGDVIGYNNLTLWVEGRNDTKVLLIPILSSRTSSPRRLSLPCMRMNNSFVAFIILYILTNFTSKVTTPVYIIMNNPFWNKFCTLVMVVMVLLNSINMGAQLDISIIVKVLENLEMLVVVCSSCRC